MSKAYYVRFPAPNGIPAVTCRALAAAVQILPAETYPGEHFVIAAELDANQGETPELEVVKNDVLQHAFDATEGSKPR